MAPRSSAALLAVAACAAAQPIEQVHLANFAPNTYSVSFKMSTPAPVTCVYGPAGGALSPTNSSTVRSYLAGAGFHHHVLLPGLAAGASYVYGCAGEGATRAFLAPPPPTSVDFTFAVLADWGYLGSAERGPSLPVGGLALNWSAVPVRELLEDLANAPAPISLVLHPGDIVYGQCNCAARARGRNPRV